MKPEIDVDPILKAHFSQKLDAQIGRAARGFAQHVQTRPTQRMRFVLMGTGIAAAVAATITLVLMPGHPVAHDLVRPAATASEGTIEQIVWSRTVDEGTVFLNGKTPARKIVRQQIREVRWSDPAGTQHIQAIAPHEDVVLISLDTY